MMANRAWLAAVVLCLAACGDDSSSDTPDAGPPPEDGMVPDMGTPPPVPPVAPPPPRDAGPDLGPPGPLSVGLMVHLKSLPWHEPTFYDRFREQLVDVGEQLQTAGAIATFEAHLDLTSQVAAREDTLYTELMSMGHAVGAHADLGSTPNPMYTQDQFVADLTLRSGQLSSLGVDARHVSGVCSELDWVAASVGAGYDFVSGIVAYCLMSLPIADRPSGFRMCASSSDCRELWPEVLAGRLRPWRVSSGATWIEPDRTGSLVVLPTGSSLPCAEEDRGSGLPTDSCDFTAEDIDLYFETLDMALGLRQPGQVNTFVTGWTWGRPLDAMLLADWLTRLQPYLDDGRVEWRTLPQMYDDYLAWEEAHPAEMPEP